MTGEPRTSARRLPVAAVALVGVVTGAVTNIVTGLLPETWGWAHNLRLMGIAFVVLGALTVVLAVVTGRPRTFTPLSPYGRRYRTWVIAMSRRLDSSGMVSTGRTVPELDDVFVDVALQPRPPGEVPSGLVSRGVPAGERGSIWRLLHRREPVVLALLGAPGSGKTTLLRHVARETARHRRGKARPEPILLQLRERTTAITADPDVDLLTLLRSTVPASVGTEPDGWWERRLRSGKCLVLLDGLDEVADDETRFAVVRWINRQLAAHPGNDFVVTSRPAGYRDAPVDVTDTVQALPFHRGQIENFLHRWYRHADPDAPVRARNAADHLLAQLDDIPGLYDLAKNPLLLSMIVGVHQYARRKGTGLPDNRAALYREMCDALLWRRDEVKGRPAEPAGPLRLAVLGRLAYSWMQRGVRGADHRALLDELRPLLAEAGSPVTPESFLRSIEGAGLLDDVGTHDFGFVHQTFQEYLAARHAAEQNLSGELAKVVDEVWWRQTLLLYAAENNPDVLVGAALESNSANALSLAFEIADSGDRLSPLRRTQLARVLDQGLQPGAPRAHRHVAVEMLTGRMLRRVTTTPESTRIIRTPVATGLYNLFLADTGTPPPDGPPVTDTDAPARGMWGGDAAGFLEWINAF